MPKLSVFNFITLDGYYKGYGNDISWHRHSSEEAEYSAESLKPGNLLLFGRVTYEMMFSFWPTPMAFKNFPVVAEGMNNAEKIVFSRTLEKAEWNNTRLIKGNIAAEIKKLKKTARNDMTLLGSGSILTQLAQKGLIDEYQIMIDPVVIGKGISIFKNIKKQLNLELTASRVFKSGTVLLSYRKQNFI